MKWIENHEVISSYFRRGQKHLPRGVYVGGRSQVDHKVKRGTCKLAWTLHKKRRKIDKYEDFTWKNKIFHGSHVSVLVLGLLLKKIHCQCIQLLVIPILTVPYVILFLWYLIVSFFLLFFWAGTRFRKWQSLNWFKKIIRLIAMMQIEWVAC